MFSKICLKRPLKKEHQKLVFNTDYNLMQVKSIAECSKGEHSAIYSTFIKLPFPIKTFVLSIFKWPFKIGFYCTKAGITVVLLCDISTLLSCVMIKCCDINGQDSFAT